MKAESMIKGSVAPVNIPGTEKILNQMKKCVCKIKKEIQKIQLQPDFFLMFLFQIWIFWWLVLV